MNILNRLILCFIFTSIFPVSFFGLRLSDVIFISILVIIPILARSLSLRKNKNNVFILILFLSILLAFAISLYSGFDLANLKNYETNVYLALKWLVTDRNIGDFFASGEYYRNTLIYLRYILFPVYFFIGWYFFINQKDPLKKIYYVFFIASILHLFICVIGFLSYSGRQSGSFNNPAELSVIALVFFIISYYQKLNYRKIIGCSLSVSLLIFSFTFSAFFALIGFVLYNLIKFYKFRFIFLAVPLISYVIPMGLSSVVSSELNKYLYIGSLLNRFNLWSVLYDIFSQDSLLFLSGLGSFPVFTDNIFWYLISGLGGAGLLMLMYFYYISQRNRVLSGIFVIVMLQGLLFPGFVMPYLISVLFFLSGFFYYWNDDVILLKK